MVNRATTAAGGETVGIEAAHVGHPPEAQAGQFGQLGHGRGRLVEHAVDAGRPVPVGATWVT